MSILLNGDCLELMKDLDDNSVDLIFTDLPYGQVSCEWDIKIDFAQMWEQFMRIKKEKTPIFFCCSTKFGAEIIHSAPKKWPMKKHEMLYVFYEKLPFYDLSSHQHKFKKEVGTIAGDNVYSKPELYRAPAGQYQPPLPTSVQKEGGTYKHLYGEIKDMDYHHLKSKMGNPVYEPPLPNSILEIKSQRGKHSTQKPTDLMKWVLKYYSKEGDVVLDPTMGSGSTGVACKEMNRNFIGMEMNPEIYEVAVSRIEE